MTAANKRSRQQIIEDRSLKYINNPSEWVRWPVVPLIHLTKMDSTGIGLCGLLFDEDRTEGYKVYHVNLFEMPMSEERFRALEISKYPTVEALLRDWRVD